jgi:hypothetical protein
MPAHLGDGTCLEETRDAIHVHVWPNGRTQAGDYKTWIPKSVIADDSDVAAKNDVGDIFVRTWFAEKEGLPHT